MKKQRSIGQLAYPVSADMENCSDKSFIPNIYSLKNSACVALIKETPLCHLTSINSNGRLNATSIPLIVEECSDPSEGLVLLGHIAKRNPHTAHLKKDMSVLGVFSGPSSYISPRWFKERLTVPTWSFSSVHVHGTLEIIEEPVQVQEILAKSIKQFEFTVDGEHEDSAEHWKLDDADEALVERLLTGIVGLKIHITSMEGVTRNVQEKSPVDRRSIAEGLSSSLNWQAQKVGMRIREILVQETETS